MESGLKSALLAAAALRVREVSLDGMHIRVREIGATEFSEYGRMLKDEKEKNRATAMLLSSCIVDENNEPLLTVEECMELTKSARVSMPLVNAVMELSGFDGKDEKPEGEG